MVVIHKPFPIRAFQQPQKRPVEYHGMPRADVLDHRVVKRGPPFRVWERPFPAEILPRKAENARIQERLRRVFLVQHGHGALELAGQPHVVLIAQGIIVVRLFRALQEREKARVKADVFPVYDLDAPLPAVCGEYGGRGIGRTVIAHADRKFEISAERQKAVELFPDIFLPVISGQKNENAFFTCLLRHTSFYNNVYSFR